MKKIRHKLILLVVAAVLVSAGCGSNSSDPEPSSNDDDKIVGTWKLTSLVVTINGKTMDVTTFDPCFLTTTLIFEADGNFSTTYATNTGNNECSEPAHNTGSWQFEGGTTYTIEGGRFGSGTRTLTFSNNNNTFSSSETTTGEFGGKGTITFERQ